MRSLRLFLLPSLLLFAAARPLVAAPLPLIDFTRDPDVSQMKLSPDGQYESFLHPDSGHLAVCCQPVGSNRATLFVVGDTTVFGGKFSKGVARYQWVNNQRLLLTTTVWDFIFGVLATDRDGSKVQGVSGLETLPVTNGVLVNINTAALLWATKTIHSFKDPDGNILMLDEHEARGGSRLFPDVVRVNTTTGTETTVEKNPGNVVNWGADQQGVVRVGMTDRGGLHFGLIYRRDGQTPWRKLELPDLQLPQICAFDADQQHLFIYALSPQHRLALYRATIDNGTDAAGAELVFRDPDYDIVSERLTLQPHFDGHSLNGVIFSSKTHAMLGVHYVREGPVTQWADARFKGYQAAVDHAMPHTVNVCVDIAKDEKRLLFLCYSDRDPGTYCLLDVDKKSISPVGKRMPWIDPAQMAQTFPIEYRARDGTPIHGYLTVPLHAQPKHLPLVVLPHGGPWVRDVWGFDRLVQFLANRGYAVLQMNYRGSTGYGEALFELGRHQVGGAIQEDIEDGTKWAVASGFADPHRIAIVGGSYGGYSVLYALAHSPGLYRCGVSIAGVTDWLRIFGKLQDEEYKYSREYWKENIGDPGTDEALLKRISPVNFAADVAAPLLVIQGAQDRTVPPSQAHALVAALKAAGHDPQTLFLSDDGHGLTSPAARREGFEAIERFLAAHLGAAASAK